MCEFFSRVTFNLGEFYIHPYYCILNFCAYECVHLKLLIHLAISVNPEFFPQFQPKNIIYSKNKNITRSRFWLTR